MDTIEITPLKIEDCESVAELDASCFSCPFTYNDFVSYISDPLWRIFVAKRGAKVLGYITLTIICDEGQIVNVAVSEGSRTQGIGASLVKKAIETCALSGAKKVFLEVRESNSVAISLYSKLGFEKIGISRNHYTKPRENALNMMLSL